MYTQKQQFIIGFHGCDKEIAEKVVNHQIDFKHSKNAYDWLGHGFYFWENNYDRALSFAEFCRDNKGFSKGKIKNPAVLGAVIDLGNCFDLLETKSIKMLELGYDNLKTSHIASKTPLPKNIKATNTDDDLVHRALDCAVIEAIHKFNKSKDKQPFDSVRAAFIQGNPVYPNANFKHRNHIQICVRNTNAIKAFFFPRTKDTDGFKHFSSSS